MVGFVTAMIALIDCEFRNWPHRLVLNRNKRYFNSNVNRSRNRQDNRGAITNYGAERGGGWGDLSVAIYQVYILKKTNTHGVANILYVPRTRQSLGRFPLFREAYMDHHECCSTCPPTVICVQQRIVLISLGYDAWTVLTCRNSDEYLYLRKGVSNHVSERESRTCSDGSTHERES